MEYGSKTQLFLCDLRLTEQKINQLATLLADDEIARAERFVYAKHRERFIAARAFLRLLLADTLGLDARLLKFNYNEFGKPTLVTEPKLFFNLSHSSHWAICGMNYQYDLGVDIEQMQPDVDFVGIAERFFATSESAVIAKLAPEQKQAAFYRCWTRKEALLKAIGRGLNFPLKDCEVTFLPEDEVKVVKFVDQSAEQWRLYSFEPTTDCLAACAVHGPCEEIELTDFKWDH